MKCLSHFFIPLLSVTCLSLNSCKDLVESVSSHSNSKIEITESFTEEDIQLESDLIPHVITAFREISLATREHNLVLVDRTEKGQAANGPAYSAGLLKLDEAAKKHGGMSKKVIESIAKTRVYEKGIFVVFDTIDEQFQGMGNWGNNAQTQVRGYVQIIDSSLRTYDRAIRYIKSNHESVLRRNFKSKGVPSEIAEEYIRLLKASDNGLHQAELKMFQTQRDALNATKQSFMHYKNPTKSKEYEAKATKLTQEAEKHSKEVIRILKGQLNEKNLL